MRSLQHPRFCLFLLLSAILLTASAAAQPSFTPGRPWPDTAGNPVQSHLGGLLFENGVYYWYGMDFRGPRIAPDTLPHQSFAWLLNLGVTVYSSTDLVTWKPAPSQLTEITYKPGGLLQPANLLVRPKVIKDHATGKFILMAALTAPDFESVSDVVYAVADQPLGPFRWMGKLGWCGKPNAAGLWAGVWEQAKSDAPERIRGFDMTLYTDGDGKSFLLTAHTRILAYELGAGSTCASHVEVMQGATGEAPALFKDRGTYYLLTSQLTGWAPNRNQSFTSPSIHGPWTPRGPFAHGPGEETTFDGQTTFVLPVQGKPHAFIFMADRFGAVSDTDIPDFTRATHIWLPIEIDAARHTLTVNWRDTWDLSAFAASSEKQ